MLLLWPSKKTHIWSANMYFVSDYAHLGHPKNLSRISPRVFQLHLLHFLFTWCFLNNRSRHWWKIEIGPCQNPSVSLCQFTEKWGPLLCDDHLCVPLHMALTTAKIWKKRTVLRRNIWPHTCIQGRQRGMTPLSLLSPTLDPPLRKVLYPPKLMSYLVNTNA